MAKHYYKDSILARKLILGTVLCSSIITLLLTCGHLYSKYRSEIDVLNQSEYIMRNSIIKSLSESVWDYDDKLIKLQLQGALSYPYIEHTKLELTDGQVFETGSIGEGAKLTYVFEINHTQRGKVRNLGSLKVTSDLESIYDELIEAAVTTLVSNALKTFFVVLFMLFLIERLVGRHLLQIASFLKDVKPEQKPTPLLLERTADHKTDDMDDLVKALNLMQFKTYSEHRHRLIAAKEKELLQLKLLEQNQQLAQLDRVFTMGEMATSLAHELNQPLASITGFADICKRLVSQPDADPAMIERTLEKVSSEAMRASEIIRRTREFVRNKTPQRDTVAIGSLIDETLSMLKDMANKSAVLLSQVSMNTELYIEADRIQLQQVMINLVRNAIEALANRPHARVVLTFRAENKLVIITICDNGPGLAKKVLDNLFQPFISTKDNGMGVGLSICHSIIEAHGGQIAVENQPEGGACFTISLPKAEIQTGVNKNNE